MPDSNIGKKVVVIAVTLILLAVLIPQHQAQAVCPATVSDCIGGVLSWMSKSMLQAMGSIISWAAEGLEKFVKPETQNIIVSAAVVQAGWTIIRNFVNLFFILVLIIMAFGTIFDLKNYTWRDLLPKFIIAALLVNFSLAIGQYIVSISNGLSSVFLKEMANFSQELARGFSLEKLVPKTEFPAAAFATIANESSSLVINLIFSIVFLVITLLAFLSAFIFSIVRIPVLWFLLIISPIAWFGYTLPNLRSQMWSAWWKHFLCWCFFLPYYLFFLMVAMIFIRQKDAISATFEPPSSFVASFTGPGGAFYNMMFYILTLIFMIGGLGMARRLSCATGTGVSKVFGKIETGVRRYAPGAAYVRGGVAGLKERGAEIAEKGVFGIGGAQKGRLQEAQAKGLIARVPGLGRVPGAEQIASKAQADEIEKEAKKIRELNLNLDDLNKKLASAKGPELYALKKVRAENGWNEVGDKADVLKTLRELKGKAQFDYINALDKGGFERLFAGPKDKEDFVKNELVGTDLLEAKKKMLRSMAHDREIFDDELIRQTTALFKNEPKEVRDKVMADLQKNVSNVYSDLTKALQSTSPAAPPPDVKRLIAKEMAEKKKVKTYAEYDAVLKTLGEQTADGQDFAKEMKDSNPLMAIEAEMRTSLGTGQFLDNEEFINKVSDELKKKDFDTIRKYSVDFFKDAAAQAAIERIYTTPRELSELLRGASKSVRIALQNLPGAAQTARERRQREPRPQSQTQAPPEAPRIVTPSPAEIPTGSREAENAEEQEAGESIARERERILRETGRIP